MATKKARTERVETLRKRLDHIDSLTQRPDHGLTEDQLLASDREYEATVDRIARARTRAVEGLTVIAGLYAQEIKETGDAGSRAHALALGFMRNVLGSKAIHPVA